MPAILALPQGVPRPDVLPSVELFEYDPDSSTPVGTGTGIIGLVPGPLSSVAPSGIPTWLVDDPAALDGIAEVPKDEALEPVEPQVPDIDAADGEVPGLEVPIVPPPSYVDIDPGGPELNVSVLEHAALPVEPSGIGLVPPGLSSTAPIGIPDGPTRVRGDVTILGDVAVLT